MFGWTFKEFIPILVMIIIFSINYFVTRPNCNWLINHDNETDKKKGAIVRKISIIGLLLAFSLLVIVTIIKLFEG